MIDIIVNPRGGYHAFDTERGVSSGVHASLLKAIKKLGHFTKREHDSLEDFLEHVVNIHSEPKEDYTVYRDIEKNYPELLI